MKMRLLIIGPNNRTFSHIVYQPSIRLGSHPECEVPIPADVSPVVSRYHAMIDLTDDGVFVTDLQSTNGTYLNGRKLDERTLLQPADEIRLGQQGPIVRAFAIDEQADAEGTMHESNLPRPQPKPKAPPPPPMAPIPLTPPPPLPAAARAAARSTALVDDSRDDSGSYYGGKPARRSKKMSSQLLIGLISGGVLLIGAVVGVLIWQLGKKSTTNPEVPLSSEEIAKRATQSSTFIIGPPIPVEGGTVNKIGTGSLIDRERRLILTAYHVIHEMKPIRIHFAKYKDGKVLSERKDYPYEEAVEAKVIAQDQSKDLAILQLQSPVPADARVLPLAAESPVRGEEVHTLGGSPQASLGLWIYTKGNVREIQESEMDLTDNNKKVIQQIRAWVIRTTNPINQGDSGGALVNKRCELVGVCSSLTDGVALVRTFIDIREVKKLLATLPEGKIEAKNIGSDPKIPEFKPTGSIDPNKLIGRWILPNGGTFEFTRDGRFNLVGNGKSFNGRYTLAGDKLTIIINAGGKDNPEYMTIKSLTVATLIIIDPDGKEVSMTRL
jgi:uncharacterized protein (TIGR03066 family)